MVRDAYGNKVDPDGWDHSYLQGQHPARPLAFVTDTDREAIEALGHVAELLSGVPSDTYRWKWVLIALHNAVQAYMVLALQGSWGVRTYKDHQAERLLAAREEMLADPQKLGRNPSDAELGSFDHFLDDVPIRKGKRKPPPELDELRLKEFLGLYAGIQDPDSMSDYMDTRPFVPHGTQTASMEHLNKIRNTFIHFVPEGFLDYIGDYPRLVEDALEVIGFLTFESNMIVWSHTPKYLARTHELLTLIAAEVAESKSDYLGVGK